MPNLPKINSFCNELEQTVAHHVLPAFFPFFSMYCTASASLSSVSRMKKNGFSIALIKNLIFKLSRFKMNVMLNNPYAEWPLQGYLFL